jgi:hypothetical protein
MTSIFDRLRTEIDHLGDRVHSALEQGKLQLEKSGAQRMRAETAQELGVLVWRKARGEATDEGRHEALLLRLDELQAQISRLDREIAASRAEDVTVGQDPPPPAA